LKDNHGGKIGIKSKKIREEVVRKGRAEPYEVFARETSRNGMELGVWRLLRECEC
jgi:hypothetical protein